MPKPSPRPLDVELLLQLKRIGPPVLSPDGRLAVATLTTPSLEKNASSSQLWLFDTAQARPRPLTACGDKDGQPAWSPRGDSVAFIARREQEGMRDTTPQLYAIAPDGGEAHRLSDFAPGVSSFKWLPDGRRIAFTAWVWPDTRGAKAQARRYKAFAERKETGHVTSQAYYRYWDSHLPQGRALHLLLLDTKTGRVTDLFEGTTLELPRDDGGNEVFDIHPGGGRIAFVHDPAPAKMLGQRQVLAEIDLRTRRIRTLVDDVRWDLGAPRYAPGGERIALLAAEVGRKHTALPQIALVQGPGRWQTLQGAGDRSVNAPLRWAPDGRGLFFTAEEAGRCHLFRADVDADTCERAHEGGWVQGFDVAAGTVVVAADGACHPARLLALGATPRRLERFNDALLARADLGKVSEVTFIGAQGDPVQMWLTFPPGFDARRRQAVLHVIHGGPFNAAGDTFSYRWNPHVFAGFGAVVAQVNYHGSSGFGFAFRDSLVGRQGELEGQDIEAATDWLLAQRWADPKRVYASGGSYGGFLVAWMNGHVPAGRYRAYVCHAGVFDRLATFSADSYPERPKDLAAKYWEDMPRVLAQSPHAFAARMATPTLVTHGARDFRVPDCNGLAYYNTLKARGVPARLLWFPDENHWVLKPRNSQQWYAEFAAWLMANGLEGRAQPSSR